MTNQSVNKAGFPDFSPSMTTRSEKTINIIHRSKVGAKNTSSAINKGNGKTNMWNRISANAQIKMPSLRFCPQQQVLQMQHLQHIFSKIHSPD